MTKKHRHEWKRETKVKCLMCRKNRAIEYTCTVCQETTMKYITCKCQRQN